MHRIPFTAAALVLMGALFAPADAVADGARAEDETHTTHEEAAVRLGPWHDYSIWVYRVRAGDTLSEIAQTQLGTMRRLREIERLNPGLDPHRVKPGQGVAMPPRKRPAPFDAAPATEPGAPRAWWDFYVLPVYDDGETGPVRIASGDKVPWHRDGVTLFAVRHDHTKSVLRAVAAAPGRATDVLERFALDGVVATSPEVLGGRRVVDGNSPVHYAVTTYEVSEIASGRLSLIRGPRRELDENRVPLGGSSSGLGGLGVGLLVVALGGLLAAGLYLRRRARSFEVPLSPGT